MTRDELNHILEQHRLWLAGNGGKRANLSGANLSYTDLTDADLRGAILTCADLWRANLWRANLRCADLSGANLSGANLTDADLTDARLTGADLWGCIGNMREVKSMQIERWPVTYTADTLQIGCQRHPISKWRKWNTDAGRRWIKQMDDEALEWADKHLALVLQIIDASPATPTGHEVTE
jgi:hypothetical protein